MNHETETVVQRFLRYVAVDTQSDPHSDKVPSTRGQLKLAKMLSTELTAMGAADVLVDEHGYVFATIPATATHSDGADLPTLGFIAHMDTSPACPGHGVQPQIFRNYQGGPLALNVEKDIILSPRTYPELLDYVGCDIITSDGTTLLGANGKAGIAEIMTMAHTLLSHPDIRHPRIRLAFTIDAEIGRSFSSFDIKTLGKQLKKIGMLVVQDQVWNRVMRPLTPRFISSAVLRSITHPIPPSGKSPAKAPFLTTMWLPIPPMVQTGPTPIGCWKMR